MTMLQQCGDGCVDLLGVLLGPLLLQLIAFHKSISLCRQ